MSTALVDRPRGRPLPCHACGLVQGWKNQRCKNPDCAAPFRKAEREHGVVGETVSRFTRMRWKTRKDPPAAPDQTPAPERKIGVTDSVQVSTANRIGMRPRIAP